jgi:hypothetical protein
MYKLVVILTEAQTLYVNLKQDSLIRQKPASPQKRIQWRTNKKVWQYSEYKQPFLSKVGTNFVVRI